LNELHLFAGIGGGILGGILCGNTTVCAVEINEYCRKILLQRQKDKIIPKFPIWDDIKTFNGIPWKGKIDLICGGFPCQDISIAGTGAGLNGERSGLWFEMLRIISEIRPTYAFMENSPIIINRGLETIIKNLAEIGYDSKWSTFSGYEIGAPIKRERWFCLAKNTSPNKIIGKYSKSNLYNKTIDENKIWSNKTFTTLLERDQKQLPIISGNERVVNGFPNSVDRFQAIGNAQIPAVVKIAWETLINE